VCYLALPKRRENNALSFDAQDAIAEQWQHPDAAHSDARLYRHGAQRTTAQHARARSGRKRGSSLFSQLGIGAAASHSGIQRAAIATGCICARRGASKLEPSSVPAPVRVRGAAWRRPSDETVQRVKRAGQAGWITSRRPQTLWPALAHDPRAAHAPLALRGMYDRGWLTAIFPELTHIECLVVRDSTIAIRWTSTRLVSAAESVGPCAYAADGALRGFRDLFAEVKDPGPRRLRCMSHRLGQGSGGMHHVEPDGGSSAGEASGRIRMRTATAMTVGFLSAGISR